MFLWQNRSIWSSPRSTAYPVTGPRPSGQCLAWVTFHGVGLKSNLWQVMSHSHKICYPLTAKWQQGPIAEDTTHLHCHQTWRSGAVVQLECLPLLSNTHSAGKEVLFTLPEEGSDHQSHPATDPVAYNSKRPVRCTDAAVMADARVGAFSSSLHGSSCQLLLC